MLPKIYMSLISCLRILYRDVTHNFWSFTLLKIIVKRISEIIWNRAEQIFPGRSETEGAIPHLKDIKMFMVPVDSIALKMVWAMGKDLPKKQLVSPAFPPWD